MDHPVAQFFPPNLRAANDMHHVLVRWHVRGEPRAQMLSFHTRAGAERGVEIMKLWHDEHALFSIIEDIPKDKPEVVAPPTAPMSE